MKYIHIQSGRYPLTESDLITENKRTSPTYPFIPFEGYAEVLPTTRPQLDIHLQKAVESTPEIIDGEYHEVWDIVDLTEAEKTEVNTIAREAAKAARAAAVEAITVTTAAGNTFDGDEISQGRMWRAIGVLQSGFATEMQWVLTDNQVISVTAAELSEALALAGAEQARLWLIQT